MLVSSGLKLQDIARFFARYRDSGVERRLSQPVHYQSLPQPAKTAAPIDLVRFAG
jgi:hypothetical protein